MAGLITRAMDCWAAFRSLPRTYGVGRRIYPSEIVAIEHIGHDPGINVTALAARLGVTLGAASQTVARLVRKALVHKRAAVESAREVRLELTALGQAAFRAHEAQLDLAYRLFLERYGRAAARHVTRFRTLFNEFDEMFSAYVRRSAADVALGGPEARRDAGGSVRAPRRRELASE